MDCTILLIYRNLLSKNSEQTIRCERSENPLIKGDYANGARTMLAINFESQAESLKA